MNKDFDAFFQNSMTNYCCPNPYQAHMGEFMVKTTATPSEIRQVAALRYRKFYAERGRKNESGEFDWLAVDNTSTHLMILDNATGSLAAVARLNIGDIWYSSSEFVLDDFLQKTDRRVELGRVCIAEAYRGRIGFQALFRGIMAYMRCYSLQFVFGCVSILDVNREQAFRLWQHLQKYNSDSRWRVEPMEEPWHDTYSPGVSASRQEVRNIISKVLRTYLSAGATVAGKPFYDRHYRSYDFFTVLDYHELNFFWKREIG